MNRKMDWKDASLLRRQVAYEGLEALLYAEELLRDVAGGVGGGDGLVAVADLGDEVVGAASFGGIGVAEILPPLEQPRELHHLEFAEDGARLAEQPPGHLDRPAAGDRDVIAGAQQPAAAVVGDGLQRRRGSRRIGRTAPASARGQTEDQ